MTNARMMTAAFGALLLTGCGGTPQSESNQTTAATNEQQIPADNAMAMNPDDPFSAAEMQMHQRMMAAQGANADDSWVRKMIEHHRGGIAMSEALLAQNPQPAVAEKARKTAADQQKDIGELEAMHAGGVSGKGAANAYAEGEKEMHDRMMAAKGDTPSETWTRKMIEHHKGAIAMSDMVIAQGGNPQVAAMASRTADKQRKEVAELERLLRGDAAPTTPAAEPRAVPKAAKASAPKATEKANAPQPASKADDPHAGHDM